MAIPPPDIVPEHGHGFFGAGFDSAVFRASNSFRHLAASSFLPVASQSCTKRSIASGMRVLPRGGIVFSCFLIPSQPASSSGSASAYFFWTSSAPPSIDFVLNVRQSSVSFFSRMARHSRSSGSDSVHFFWSRRLIPICSAVSDLVFGSHALNALRCQTWFWLLRAEWETKNRV